MTAHRRIPDVSRGVRPTRAAAAIPPPSQADQVAELAAELDRRLWALAVVTPCSEAVTARHLRLHGLIAYQPTRETRRRSTRGNRHPIVVERPALPGYLLVGLHEAAPQWHHLFGAAHVRGIVGSARTARALGRVIAAWCAGISDQRDAFERRAEPPAVGERVTVAVAVDVGEPLRLHGRVVALDGRQVRVLAEFFGAQREILADLAGVERVEA